MKTKSTAQIQADITLMRLAYQDRQARHDSLNRYLSEPNPITSAKPYLISAALILSAAGFIAALFIL